jgi:hypothetical protein
MTLTLQEQVLSFFLPERTLLFFDIVSGGKTDSSIQLTLEEKNDPPLEDRHRGMSVLSKGFHDITITDFPARGRKVSLTFRRRRWQVGDELLVRDIPIASAGTQLEKEFAAFLKAHG